MKIELMPDHLAIPLDRVPNELWAVLSNTEREAHIYLVD